MKKVFVFLPVIAIAVMFNACSKTGNTGPQGTQGPAGPSYTGSISGHVELYNQYGDEQPAAACKAVRVILYNSSNAVVDSINADSTGKYVISSVTTGYYTMAFRDTNYGQELHEDFQFLGSTSEPLEVDAKLSHAPSFTFTIANDSIHNKTNDTLLYIYGTVSAAASQSRYLAVFAGSSLTVSSTPGTYSSIVANLTIPAGATTFDLSIPVNNFYLGGLMPGQMAYMTAYAAPIDYASTSDYEDYTTGQTTYTSLGTSATVPAFKL